MLENTEGTTQRNGNIGYTRQRQKTQTQRNSDGHHNTQTKANNVNKT